jgi:diketogulonate reductase-like aldo/keto reductase
MTIAKTTKPTKPQSVTYDRRWFIQSALATITTAYLPLSWALPSPKPTANAANTINSSSNGSIITKLIPSTRQQIPAIGMGSWMTFNVGNDVAARQNCTQVLNAFFAAGGTLIDSSPMYGSSEEVIGFCLQQLKAMGAVTTPPFSATKVWTPFQSRGETQIQTSHQLWGTGQIDLLQIHNLVSWQKHLDTLQQMKSDNKLRYIGITTSHSRRHDELEKIIRSEKIDFVQLTYNVLDTEAESRLLPLAQEKGIAVIANRPFQRKGLFRRFAKHPLPPWAKEAGCMSWAQYFLQFIISHPAITCVIPATSQVAHMQENMAVLRGPLADATMRARMQAYLKTL